MPKQNFLLICCCHTISSSFSLPRKDYDGSAAAYKNSASAAETINLEILRGLTNALLAAKKPNEAVPVLSASSEALNSGSLDKHNAQADGNSNNKKDVQKIDPIQVELLLGKAYSDWGHFSDAVSVYDRLFSMYPDDFRGYLAKNRLQQFEETLKISPKDPDAIEGAAVTLAELGEYTKATSLLEMLVQERPRDSEAYRVLGERKFELKDY